MREQNFSGIGAIGSIISGKILTIVYVMGSRV